MKKLLYTTAIACSLSLATQASAQSLDYKTMQDMFGEPVTTSANGSPQRASDVPLDMTIITAEDIERYPATEIPDILRHYAGISVRQNSATEYSVGIRGINSPMNERILVLVNGRQVFEDYFGLVNWSSIPVELSEIRQIEIVRGPNTALFGFNATSGVVNIVTHNPLYDDTDIVEGDAGINGNYRGAAITTLQNKEGTIGSRITISGRTADEDTNNTNPNTTSALYDNSLARSVAVDTALQLNEKTQMRVELSRTVTDENVLDPYYDGYGRNSINKAARVNVTSDTNIGIVEASVYKNSVNAIYNNTSFTSTTQFGFNNDVTVLQLSDTFKVGTDHTIRIAGEYRQNDTDHNVNIISASDLGTTGLNIKSLSTLWYWNINPKLALSTALRYDHVDSDFDGTIIGTNPYTNEQYNNRYDETGYNIGLVYKATPIDTLRASASKGIDLPSSFELGLQGGSSSNGNPLTEASEIYDYQLGYERKISDIGGSFKTTAFYQQIYDQQGFLSGTQLLAGNIGDIEVYGIELTLDGNTSNGIRWGANYSYAKTDHDLKSNSTVSIDDETSNHIVNARVGYSPTDQWDLDLFASYQSNFDQARGTGASTVANESFSVEPDVIVDARIGYKPMDKLTLSLNGRALLGDNEQSSYGEDVDSQIFLRAKYEF